MWRYTEKLPRAFNLDVSITEMTMQRGLYHHAVCHMDEVRQLPRPMGRVRFTPVDVPKPFADGSLGAANLDVVAIRRDENIDKSPRHVCNCPQAARANNLLLARLGATTTSICQGKS